MLKSRLMRGRVIAGAMSLAGATAVVVAFSAPAGASETPPNLPTSGQTQVLSEGGSFTTYGMMQALSDLYNAAPGCNLVPSGASAATQDLNYTCASPPSAGAENGLNITDSPNPFNDVWYQNSALGSSNGVDELEPQGAGAGIGGPSAVTPIDAARSSRAPRLVAGAGQADGFGSSTQDSTGLNFVAYAQDAVPWFHFTAYKIGSKKETPAGAAIKDLSDATLTQIYEGNVTNWSSVCDDVNTSVCGKSGLIDLFIAQNGSGTESTWAGDLHLGKTAPTTKCGTGYPFGCEDNAHEIFENEDSNILTVNDGANPNESTSKCVPTTQPCSWNAIFLFSYGKFTHICPKGVCPATPKTNKGTVAALGGIDDVVASPTTITNQTDGGSPTFFTDRLLYNVYADGTNCGGTNYCSSSPGTGNSITKPQHEAAENFVSTYGFLCSTTVAGVVDPNSPSEQTFGQEISADISAQGFFPIGSGNMGDGATGVQAPDFGSSDFYGFAPTTGDNGTCRVTSTNG
jgi:ABC-type phosphate transport system substrate-binding protein